MTNKSVENSQPISLLHAVQTILSKSRVSRDRNADKLSKVIEKFIREAKRNLKNCKIQLDENKRTIIFSQNEAICKLSVATVVKGCRIDKRNSNNDSFALIMKNVGKILQRSNTESYESTKDKIIPFIRRKRINCNGLGIGKDVLAPYYGIEISDDATVMFGITDDLLTMFLTEDDINEWNITISEVMSQALKNLGKGSSGSLTEISTGVFVINCDNSNYFLKSMISDLNLNVSGDPVVMTPTSDCLLVTGANDILGQIQILEFAQDIVDNSSKPLSSNMYIVVDNVMELFIPSDEKVIENLQSFKTRALYFDYSLQNKFIDELIAEHGTEIFPAQFMAAQEKTTEKEFSFCAWTDGVDSLLPKTDLIALSRVDHIIDGSFNCQSQQFEWDEVINSSIGGLMQKIDSFPVRYRVKNFPSLEQIESLKSGKFKE